MADVVVHLEETAPACLVFLSGKTSMPQSAFVHLTTQGRQLSQSSKPSHGEGAESGCDALT